MSLIICVDRENGREVWERKDGPATKEQMAILEVPGVQNPTVAWARRNGIHATKLQGVGNRSQPDYMFRYPHGNIFLIEFKRAGKEPTPLQSHTILEWQADGFKVEVHDTKESAIAALQSWKWGIDSHKLNFPPGAR